MQLISRRRVVINCRLSDSKPINCRLTAPLLLIRTTSLRLHSSARSSFVRTCFFPHHSPFHSHTFCRVSLVEQSRNNSLVVCCAPRVVLKAFHTLLVRVCVTILVCPAAACPTTGSVSWCWLCSSPVSPTVASNLHFVTFDCLFTLISCYLTRHCFPAQFPPFPFSLATFRLRSVSCVWSHLWCPTPALLPAAPYYIRYDLHFIRGQCSTSFLADS